MRSSDGRYFVGLDHLRALAAFLVFQWHFIHLAGVPTDYLTPLSIISQGHCGVGLFMTLSGYLFAKLLDGKDVLYRYFLWNRFVRLAPLLLAVFLVVGLRHHLTDLLDYAKTIARGFITAEAMPNGSWSIVAEVQFYALLPVLLYLARISPLFLLGVIGCMVAIRLDIYLTQSHDLRWLAYWTLIGRFDEFVFGILAFHYRDLVTRKHWIAVSIVAALSAFYYAFALSGGYNVGEHSFYWVILTTVEGAACAALIAYYDTSFSFSKHNVASNSLALIGTVSYSYYLLHFFVVYKASELSAPYVGGNFYVGLAIGCIAFLAFVPVAAASFFLYERHFLRFRTKYTLSSKLVGVPHAA